VLYNSSFMLSGDSVSQYHKSKLVPGTEIMPFISYLPFLEELAVGLDENSTTGTLGTSNNYNPINFEQHSLVPAICYESIYGQHLARFVRNGAQFIAIITNDAWWGNTPGYKQHFSYARLRAIENRKWVARSANTGISGFINSKGEVVQQSEYDNGPFAAYRN
jgi:apolipoprotein N-acyltransferase